MDITVHQVSGGGTLKELMKASGGAWGGTRVDDAFHQFFVKIVGKQACFLRIQYFIKKTSNHYDCCILLHFAHVTFGKFLVILNKGTNHCIGFFCLIRYNICDKCTRVSTSAFNSR